MARGLPTEYTQVCMSSESPQECPSLGGASSLSLKSLGNLPSPVMVGLKLESSQKPSRPDLERKGGWEREERWDKLAGEGVHVR